MSLIHTVSSLQVMLKQARTRASDRGKQARLAKSLADRLLPKKTQ